MVPSNTNGGMLESNEEEMIYFNTNYTEKTSVLIVEVVITREFNYQKFYASGGYAVCPIYEFG